MSKPLILLFCWTAAIPGALLAETPATEMLAAEALADEMLAIEAPVAETRAVAGPVEEADASKMMSTTWTLDNPAPPPVKAAPANGGTANGKAATRAGKPRVFGGARASNSRQKSRKAGAKVGVALPF